MYTRIYALVCTKRIFNVKEYYCFQNHNVLPVDNDSIFTEMFYAHKHNYKYS